MTRTLIGEGLRRLGQGASTISTRGGTVRLGELVGNQPIRHVIKINPFAGRYCYCSEEVLGWRWPARAADAHLRAATDAGADAILRTSWNEWPETTVVERSSSWPDP